MVTRTLLRTAVVPAAPAEVWEVIGAFGAFPDWHPHLLPSTIENGADPETPGAVRAFTYEGKVVLRERLLAKDPAAHMYRYSVEAPSFAVAGYEATLCVHPHEEGAEVRWEGTYEAASADAVAQVERLFGDGTYATGLAALRERFAR
ncbi:SRPBCC family protein [Streptomyces sp. NPDC002209]|uniref:SRPBCC family protein n=1 Tax=Streptomyces sp. NPDC002209 TaxID=3364638 RepID=UPI00368D7DC1